MAKNLWALLTSTATATLSLPHSTSRYVPLFLVLFLFFSGCFHRRKRRDGMPLSAWMLLGPNAAYYWSELVTASHVSVGKINYISFFLFVCFYINVI